jgi:hypothetical protein
MEEAKGNMTLINVGKEFLNSFLWLLQTDNLNCNWGTLF